MCGRWAARRVDVDDVDVAEVAGRQHAAVEPADLAGRALGQVVDHQLDRQRPSARCVHSASAVVGKLPSQIAPQWAPASLRPITEFGDSSISRTSSRLPWA